MIINVKVKPHSKEDKLERVGENEYIVSVKEPAENNKANTKLIKMLSKYFDTNYKHIMIKNPTSRKKVVYIKD